MSRFKLNVTYFFLFVVPYVTAIFMISSAYDALVQHWDNWWRLGVGGLVGACIMLALKIIIQRPLGLLVLQDPKSWVAHFGKFFLIDQGKVLVIFNLILDFILSIAGIYFIHWLLPRNIIIQSSLGWPIVVMFISTAIGSYLAYDILSIDPEQR
ncbi:hypothetical protein [Lapidilactobacillus gannanensis]|uniref:Integral membrane protein n=1 Tax=Lapidilactobacillus gannanensis TaxID=2486002 RepID=A0ABW4BLJ5_9LACO|nr:hypothetical protein [Lapidilactobacillus gannanensis]